MKRTALIPAVSKIGYLGGMLIGKTDTVRVKDASLGDEAYEIIIKKDITLKFRGSSNQRVIDLKKTLEEGKIVLLME